MTDDTQEKEFLVANEIGRNKEKAILDAINHYFEGKPWTEAQITAIASSNIYSDGRELFLIDGKPMVEFGKLETDVVINVNHVYCTFYQQVKALY